MKNISILGSTGSIGTQTLDVIRNSNNWFKVFAITAKNNYKLLYNQALEFKPAYCVIDDDEGYTFLKEHLKIYNIKVLRGVEGLNIVASHDSVDIVLNAVVGMIGLEPTITAIKANKIIALANKETMVTGGELINKELKNSKASIIPVDSEHNAIFQCMQNGKYDEIRKLILTASGGPFRGMKKNQLKDITPDMAIKHPKWNMGKKISIDSSTLMNKGLEVIEAHYLFNMPYDKIDVIIHPQSMIHSMVEYVDGSIISQISTTDMRHPIQYALCYPNRLPTSSNYVDLFHLESLSFEEPDFETFESLSICYNAGKIGGSMPAAINAGNEEAVNLFLKNKVKFLDIQEILKFILKSHKTEYNISLNRILNIQNEYIKIVDDLAK